MRYWLCFFWCFCAAINMIGIIIAYNDEYTVGLLITIFGCASCIWNAIQTGQFQND